MSNIKHRAATLRHTICRYEKILKVAKEKPEDVPQTRWYAKRIYPAFPISQRTYERVLSAPIGMMKRELQQLEETINTKKDDHTI